MLVRIDEHFYLLQLSLGRQLYYNQCIVFLLESQKFFTITQFNPSNDYRP
jgi:hypothetical protein